MSTLGPISEDLLLDYLYDELAPKERAHVEAALRESPELQTQLTALQSTRALFSEVKAEESRLTAPALYTRALQVLQAEKESRPSLWQRLFQAKSFWGGALALSAAALVVWQPWGMREVSPPVEPIQAEFSPHKGEAAGLPVESAPSQPVPSLDALKDEAVALAQAQPEEAELAAPAAIELAAAPADEAKDLREGEIEIAAVGARFANSAAADLEYADQVQAKRERTRSAAPQGGARSFQRESSGGGAAALSVSSSGSSMPSFARPGRSESDRAGPSVASAEVANTADRNTYAASESLAAKPSTSSVDRGMAPPASKELAKTSAASPQVTRTTLENRFYDQVERADWTGASATLELLAGRGLSAAELGSLRDFLNRERKAAEAQDKERDSEGP